MLRAVSSLSLAVALALSSRPAHGYGEPAREGLPNMEERLLVVLTNQVRAAPHDWPGWDTRLATGEPRPPLAMSDALLEAARFHGDDMAAHGHFAHESSDGTTFGDRVSRYFQGGGAGENIYTGYAGGARAALDGWMSSDGHRRNILEARWNLLGPGFTLSGSQRFYVQDFGELRASTVPAIPAGALEPSGATTATLLASWYDASGAAPASFEAVLDGEVIPLALTAGRDGNAIYSGPATLPACCGPLHFTAVAASGARTTYPSSGALLVGRGCTADFTVDGPGAPGGEERPLIDAESSGCSSTTPRTGGGSAGAALLGGAMLLSIAARRRERGRTRAALD